MFQLRCGFARLVRLQSQSLFLLPSGSLQGHLNCHDNRQESCLALVAVYGHRLTRLKQHVNFYSRHCCSLKQKPSSMERSEADAISCRLRLCKSKTVPVGTAQGSPPKSLAVISKEQPSFCVKAAS